MWHWQLHHSEKRTAARKMLWRTAGQVAVHLGDSDVWFLRGSLVDNGRRYTSTTFAPPCGFAEDDLLLGGRTRLPRDVDGRSERSQFAGGKTHQRAPESAALRMGRRGRRRATAAAGEGGEFGNAEQEMRTGNRPARAGRCPGVVCAPVWLDRHESSEEEEEEEAWHVVPAMRAHASPCIDVDVPVYCIVFVVLLLLYLLFAARCNCYCVFSVYRLPTYCVVVIIIHLIVHIVIVLYCIVLYCGIVPVLYWYLFVLLCALAGSFWSSCARLQSFGA